MEEHRARGPEGDPVHLVLELAAPATLGRVGHRGMVSAPGASARAVHRAAPDPAARTRTPVRPAGWALLPEPRPDLERSARRRRISLPAHGAGREGEERTEGDALDVGRPGPGERERDRPRLGFLDFPGGGCPRTGPSPGTPGDAVPRRRVKKGPGRTRLDREDRAATAHGQPGRLGAGRDHRLHRPDLALRRRARGPALPAEARSGPRAARHPRAAPPTSRPSRERCAPSSPSIFATTSLEATLARAIALHATPVAGHHGAGDPWPAPHVIPVCAGCHDGRGGSASTSPASSPRMRHRTSAYDSMKIAKVKGRRREVRRLLASAPPRRLTRDLDAYRRGGGRLHPDAPVPAARTNGATLFVHRLTSTGGPPRPATGSKFPRPRHWTILHGSSVSPPAGWLNATRS